MKSVHRSVSHPPGLQFPNKLYGRDQDIQTLLSSFEQICLGSGKVQLVAGRSGIGKTALVREIRASVGRSNGFFLEGKFNQYQQDVPYFAIRQALAALCGELSRDDEQQRQRWRCALLNALGEHGQLLIDLVPELELLLGKQAPVAQISALEARHRFEAVFREFLKVICQPEHPVVLFIDDWQWADRASLDLLSKLQVNVSLQYLLVIVAYRDNEVEDSHPLIAAIDDLRHQATPLDLLEVCALTLEDVRALLQDALKPALDNLDGLAELVQRRTAGNPFFTRVLIEYLYSQGLIKFAAAQQCWQCNLLEINENQLPINVVELFVRKLGQLPPATRSLLSLAACLGNRFELETLAIISAYAAEHCRYILQSPQLQDLVVPATDAMPGCFLFLHDRVQQAAYGFIPAAELTTVRLQIGRRLLAYLSPEQLAEQIYQVVDHLNIGYQLIQNTDEQISVLKLNVEAARKAHIATAYRAALQFLQAAARAVASEAFAAGLWAQHHPLAMQFYLAWAEAEFLEGDRKQSEYCVQQAVAHAADNLEKAAALNVLIVHFTLLSRYPEAIQAGREALAVLGIVLPDDDFETVRDIEIAQVRQALSNQPVADLFNLPVMSDPEMCMATKLLITMGPPCYRSHQRLWSVLVPKVVNLTIRYGNLPQIGYSHTAFGGLLGWVDNDYATAKAFGELASRLMTTTFTEPTDQSVFYLMIGSSVRHWFQPLTAGSRDYALAYETGLRFGNLQYAAYAFGHNVYCRFYQGTPLTELSRESQWSLDFSRTRVNQWAIDLLEGGLRVFAALSTAAMADDAVWEADYLRQVDEHHNIQVKCIYLELKACSWLLLRKFQQALAYSDQAACLLYTVGTQGLLPWPEHVFARALIISGLFGEAVAERQVVWQAELEGALAQLTIWAGWCPENFAHKQQLVAGEIARLQGRLPAALQLYRQAAEAAAAQGFLQWQGLANEYAARLLESHGQGRIANVYWQQAHRCYYRWGATAKVNALEADYRAVLALDLPRSDQLGLADPACHAELLTKQLQQLRSQSSNRHDDSLETESLRKSQQLAEAAERLRVEVAERKRAEQQLQQHRNQLEATVKQRTADLEASRDQLIDARINAVQLMEQAIAARDRSEIARVALEQEMLERQKMMEALIVSEREFHLLAEAMPQIVWVANAEGKTIYVNEQWVAYTGEPLTKSHGHGWIKLFHPDDQQSALDAWRQALNGHGTVALSNECRLRRADGVYRWWLIRGVPVLDEHGNVYKWFGTCTDIEDLKAAERELQVIERRLNLALEFSQIGVWEMDLLHDTAWRSLKHDQIFGYETLQPAWGMSYALAHVLDKDRGKFTESFEAAKRNGVFFLECRIRHQDQSIHWINAQGRVVYDDHAQPIKILGTVMDITERKLIEREMGIAATIFDSQEGMIVADLNRLILRVNPAFTRITGYNQAEVVGKNLREFKSGRQDAGFYDAMWLAVDEIGVWKGEVWSRRKSGEIYPEHLIITAVKDQSHTITNYVATFNDISMSKAAEEEIKNLAFFDPLTGLPNRRLLMDRLKQALAGSLRGGNGGALMFLDLDNFKALNDSLGHNIGDLLLKQVAVRLINCVRDGDTVARLGGDEFVVILENLSAETAAAAAHAEVIARKILTSLNKAYQLDAHVYNSTPSIGITLYGNQGVPGERRENDELLRQADIAMYQAKKAGCNGIRFFDPQMQENARQRLAMESELRLALDDNQFCLYYQIQTDETNRIIGAEALIRWRHPERGLVSPLEFIPLAEETGLILHIGNWVLESACKVLKDWCQLPVMAGVSLSINVSAKQFHQTDFIAQVKSAVQRHGVKPNQLKLELTESMLLNNIDDTIAKMTALKKMGIQISLDDFGTGYSSLQYLKLLPIDQLKIDQSFVRDITIDDSDKAIVRTIIAMAHTLNLKVIAEGVETEEQRQMLMTIGCGHYQGYLFSKPVPFAAFCVLLDAAG